MAINWIGLTSGLAAFLGIWIGHVSVRKIEARSRTIWVPALVFLFLGLAFEAGALLSENLSASGTLGILGMTVLWDALELVRQERRVKKGHAPANPQNPRHARILAEYPLASAVDWLARQPLGRPYTPEELTLIAKEGGR